MLLEYRSISLVRRWLVSFGVPFLLALSVSSCGNDLSDLNALAEQSIRDNATSIEIYTELSTEQVVAATQVTSNHTGDAQFIVNLATNSISGHVNIQQRQDNPVQRVQLRRGFGGRNGDLIVELSPHGIDPGIWQLPDNYVLGDADMELLLRGGLYVLVATVTHNNGELRGQLLFGGQELLINPLSAGQLLNFTASDDSVSAISYLSVNFFTGEIQGSVRQLTGIAPAQVSMHVGLAGTEGEEILPYEPDVTDANVWHIPNNRILSEESLQQLEAAQLYVQASGAAYPEGAIRGQLYLPYYLVSITGLSGFNLMPQVNSQATGKAFVTLNAFDGVTQAIVRLSGLAPASVILVRTSNPNSTESGRLLFTLESQDDYWQLPAGTILENSDFNDISMDRLMFIATSPSYPLGEIGGRI
jgi:hypothetical protein